MAESTTKHGFESVSGEQVAAGQMVVTPSAQPAQGVAFVELAGRMKSCAVNVDGAVLVISLPRRARVGDIVHWTSYDQ